MIFVCYDVLHLKLFGGVQEPFAFLTVLHVIVWLVSFVYDRYLHFHHHALRKFGYLDLFLKTKEVRRVPMMMFSTGNAVLLLIVAFTASRSDDDFSLVRIFQVVASIEVLNFTYRKPFSYRGVLAWKMIPLFRIYVVSFVRPILMNVIGKYNKVKILKCRNNSKVWH